MEARPPSSKLRLMCSYGGQILPRPPTNSLSYVGGATRIVSMDRRTVTTLSSLVSHLFSALSLNSPFSLKYRLPHLDLDSLISLASDDDFYILIDELNRLSSSRIRLFVFPLIPHPQTEAWFFDALKNATIMQNSMQPDHPHPPDSMLLETSSSFESTSSSASFTNFPPIRPHADDDNDTLRQFPSDNSVSGIVSYSSQQNISYQYQDPAVETRLRAESIEVESKMPCISSWVIPNNTNIYTGSSSFPQFNNQVKRPHLQFVQAAANFLPLHQSGLSQVPSCQLVYQPPRPLKHPPYHHPNQLQPCPVYLVPIANIPPNNCQTSSFNLNASSMNCRAAQNDEVRAVSTFAHGFSSQNYLTDNETTSFVYVPCNASQQREMDVYPMHQRSQNISVSVNSRESLKYGNEMDDELAHVQIYKSQPPPPTASSKHRTMKIDATNLLSQAFAQLHVDSLKQQTET